MRVGVLGTVEVWRDDGQPLALTPQARRLLALLVATERMLTSDQIGEHVLDGRVDGSAVRTAVSRLRKVLGDSLETLEGGYRLQPGTTLDCQEFEALREPEPSRPVDERRAALETALALWRGPAFDGFADADWAMPSAHRLDEARAATVEDLAALLLDDGLAGRAALLLEPHVLEHPYRERPVGLLMRALAESGRLTEATRTFQRFRTSVAEAGLDVSPSLDRLDAELLSVDHVPDAQGPALRSAVQPSHSSVADVPGNLPRPLSRFVGRVEELAELGSLADTGRLLTLTGPGGSGKTRLAVELASRRAIHHPDGVWFVDLAPLSSETFVADEVASTIQVAGGDADANERIATRLADTETLLVLDNAEHILDAVAELVDTLLSRCRRIVVVATSREPLQIPGERVWRVPPMAIGTEGESGGDAVALFLDRAAQVTSVEPPIDAVASICRRLDGIPLAIELAAARLDVLSASQIEDRLDQRLALLKGSGRTTVPRHRTLYAAIEWSHQLLDDDCRTLLRRLAVFSGGFSLGGAERVCSGDDLPADRVLDTLTSLIRKSLVTVWPDGDEHRYRLLDTIREYAADELETSGEAGAVRRAHCDWVVEIYDAVMAEDVDQAAWMRTLIAEQENLDAALDWATRLDDPTPGLRLVGAAGPYWVARASAALAWHWSSPILATPAPPSEVRLLAIAGAMPFARDMGELGTLHRWEAEGWEILDSVDVSAHPEIAFLINSAEVEPRISAEQRIALGRRAAEVARAAGRVRDEANSLMTVATHTAAVDPEGAVTLGEQTFELSRRCGHVYVEAHSALELVALHERLHNPADAVRYRAAALEAARRLGDNDVQMSLLAHDAAAALCRDVDEAASMVDELRSLADESGGQSRADATTTSAWLAWIRGDADVIDRFRAAERQQDAVRQPTSARACEAMALLAAGKVASASEIADVAGTANGDDVETWQVEVAIATALANVDVERARRWIAVAHARATGPPDGSIAAWVADAFLLLEADRIDEAGTAFETAFELAAERDDLLHALDVAEGLACVAAAEGDAARATSVHGIVMRLRAASGMARNLPLERWVGPPRTRLAISPDLGVHSDAVVGSTRPTTADLVSAVRRRSF